MVAMVGCTTTTTTPSTTTTTTTTTRKNSPSVDPTLSNSRTTDMSNRGPR